MTIGGKYRFGTVGGLFDRTARERQAWIGNRPRSNRCVAARRTWSTSSKPSPQGVEVVPGYDRSGLLRVSVETLQRDLLEEAIIVSLVIIIFLFHFRSALIPILTLPIAVVASFIPIYYLHVSSSIMSLGGSGSGDWRVGGCGHCHG
jgi:AcrB/AcrD/AcrF family